MNKKEYQFFLRRYDKFKKNNLPTPFWDEERQTLEYVRFRPNLHYIEKNYVTDEDSKKLVISDTITYALEELSNANFYYPFSYKKNEGNSMEVEYDHQHFFDGVVGSLYRYPETFYISKEDESYYSKQELEYLRRVQKYLLFIGLKDLKRNSLNRVPINRYRNKKQKKYGSWIITLDDEDINNIVNGEKNFCVLHTVSPDENYPDEDYLNHDYTALVADKEDNIIAFIEYTHDRIKTYKEIKSEHNDPKLKDDDKVLVRYYKVLEIFKK